MEKIRKLIANNKKATFNYYLEENFQAGIELLGMEVKSLRAGRCNIAESHVEIRNSEAFIVNMHISPYENAQHMKFGETKDPLRRRRLLLHKREIKRLIGATSREGMTIVPVKIYFQGHLVKLDIALARGKKNYDKRADMAKKDMRRQTEKDFKIKNL